MEDQSQTIRISVRELVEFLLRSGDIDNRHGGGLPDREAMQEGSRIHRKIQGRMGGNYRSEVPLSMEFPGDGYCLLVEGRADGIFSEFQKKDTDRKKREETGKKAAAKEKTEASESAEETQKSEKSEESEPPSDLEAAESEKTGQESQELWYIDEIKTMYRDASTLEEPFALHLAQAKCYACIYLQQMELNEIGVQMTYCTQETEAIRRFRSLYQREELIPWFDELIAAYHKWAKLQTDWKIVRENSLKKLEFPFPWRAGQRALAQDVYRTILRKKTLFIQAPTGTGKTLSTVYPSVKAMGEGLCDRIFYATAKTITRTVAEEAFGQLRKEGMRLKTVTLTAKEKICFCEETECNPDACPYAKGHYDRVNHAVYELITENEALSREVLIRQAQKWQVCPFEMSLDAALWADAVICDYNYLFDPRAKLKRFFSEGSKGSYMLLIDEAHNLVDRAREMFSASLYKEDFLALKKAVKPHSRKMTRALDRCNAWLLEKKREQQEIAVHEGVGMFPVYLMNLCGVMEEFMEDCHDAVLGKQVQELYFQVRTFLEVSDRLDENYVVYSELTEDGRFLFKLYCVDTSGNLQECLDRSRSTVFFSATFLPIQYYKSLLSSRKDNYAIYAEPVFDPAKRFVVLGTDTSSRYQNRTREEYARIAEYILRTIQTKRGNYMVFFSSYRMMEDTAEQFALLCSREEENIELQCQQPGMTELQREEFLECFEEVHDQGLAGFCVMGGIFGEGIDLKEERLIGAIVVGTGIPQVCRERELLKNFFDQRGQDGFFYSYLCPGMNKVLQSAGRVIRTDTDEGVILLLDERFKKPLYRQLFPTEWGQPPCCTLGNVQTMLRAFWNRPEKMDGEKYGG